MQVEELMRIEEYRGGLMENVHDVRVCVVDSSGRSVFGCGSDEEYTFYRSCAKPFQLLPLVSRGLDKKFGLSEDEVTICAASHAAEEMHVAALESIAKKAKLSESDLIMLPALPFNAARREEIIRSGSGARKIYHNCSGKHFALMILQRELTGSIEGYWQEDSEAQREVIAAVSDMSGYPISQIKRGIDGCGVPVFAVPIRGIAHSFVRLGCPELSPAQSQTAYIASCIKKHPYMISGRGFYCGEINTVPNIIGKAGAEGVYGFGLSKEKLGVAIKIMDGNGALMPIAVSAVLKKLGYNDQTLFDILEKLKPTQKTNDNKTEIGSYRAVFCSR